MTRPLKLATDRREINHARIRVRDLERRVPAGDWVYVGAYPTDPGTTPDSPEFVNGSNTGNGSVSEDELTRFRWKIGLGAALELQVNVDGVDPGEIIFTLPPFYWPSIGKQPFPAVDNGGGPTCVTVVPRDDGSSMADVYAGRL